ncbi:MAG: hypothetical protein JXA97_13545 [Anaerolineales bacterium]|nr:hypothetical protein [Anaerolineales bacterium]
MATAKMDDPCKETREQAERAAVELDYAARATRSFRVTKPLDPATLEQAPLTPRDLERMGDAYIREREAFNRYKTAMAEWYDCQKNHGLIPDE